MFKVSPTRRTAFVAALALGLLVSSTLRDVAGAQDAPSPSTPQGTSAPPPSTTAPTPQEPSPEPPTTVAAPDTSLGMTTTTRAPRPERPEETATSIVDTSVPDTSIAPPPPDGVIETQTESVPIVPPALVELPTRGRGVGRVVAGVPARVRAMVQAAKEANEEMLARLSEAEQRNGVTEREVATAQARVDRMTAKERLAMAELAEARRKFEERVRWAYTRGPTATLEGILQSQDAAQLTDRRAMVEFVLQEDANAVGDYLELRDSVSSAVATADDMLSRAEHAHATTQIATDAARADVALTSLAVGMWNRATRGLSDILFPVVGTHAFGADFGNPRMVGTTDAHTHEGNDIVAPLGAQLVAVEPGMVVAIGTDRLGGNKLWLAGKSGTYYYYAHLSRFAEEVHEGDIVPAGTVVGYVGNTGNAQGGIPHVHFEVHPNGGPAVDPYPYLAAADQRQRREKWATSP